MDGRSVRYRIVRQGPNRLVETQESGAKVTTLTRDFSPEGMSVALEVNGVKSSSFFSRTFDGGGGDDDDDDDDDDDFRRRRR